MIEPKYNVGDKVYLVRDYVVVKVVIEEVIIRKTKDKETLEYTISPIVNTDEKKVSKTMPEAYLVEDFKTAKESATTNWENIYKKVKNGLINLKEEDFDLKEVKEND